MKPIQRSSAGIVQLVMRQPVAGRPADSQFFATWDTLAQAGWRADVASGMLQMRPGEHYGVFPYAQEFHALTDIEMASTEARANPKFGPGGGVKLIIEFKQQLTGNEHIGDLIPLLGFSEPCDPRPSGGIKDILDLETSLGNTLVGADRVLGEVAKRRFWMQNPLHDSEIAKRLHVPQSIRPFEDLDIHGDVAGFVDLEDMQVVGAPGKNP